MREKARGMIIDGRLHDGGDGRHGLDSLVQDRVKSLLGSHLLGGLSGGALGIDRGARSLSRRGSSRGRLVLGGLEERHDGECVLAWEGGLEGKEGLLWLCCCCC